MFMRKGSLAIVASIIACSFIVIVNSLSKDGGEPALSAFLLPQNDELPGLTFIINSHDHTRNLAKVDFANRAFVELGDGEKIKASTWILIQDGYLMRGKLYFPPDSQPQAIEEEISLVIDLPGADYNKSFTWPRG